MASLTIDVEVDLSSFRLILMAQRYVSQQIAGMPEGRVPSADLLELQAGLMGCIEKFNARHVGSCPSKDPFFGEVGMAVDDLAALTIDVAAAEATSQLPCTPHFADSLRKAASIFAFIRHRADNALYALAMAGFEPDPDTGAKPAAKASVSPQTSPAASSTKSPLVKLGPGGDFTKEIHGLPGGKLDVVA